VEAVEPEETSRFLANEIIDCELEFFISPRALHTKFGKNGAMPAGRIDAPESTNR